MRGSIHAAAMAASMLGALAGNAGAQHAHSQHAAQDSAFHAVQRRGADPRAMGVDQYTSKHQFDIKSDGARIELQRAVDDSAGVAQIRRHLQEIARAFAAGDFSTPAFVHMRDVPGTAVMSAKRDAIRYLYRELPRGGELRIVTSDADALAAIREFIEFQRSDHRAGGSTTHAPAARPVPREP